MTQVLVLNLAYDIGVKQVSLHLILLCLFLLAPELRRLADFFIFDRPVAPSSLTPLFRTQRANRIALVVQIVFGVYLLALQADVNWVYWYAEGGGRPKSALYGIWNVEELLIDGQSRPHHQNDYDRQWRRIIFDATDTMVVQRPDDSFARYGVNIDPYAKTLALTKGQSRTWKSAFRFERASADQLTLDGEMDGYKIRARLQLVDFDTFRLLNSAFRWVRTADP
jgi:hypothetical protein